MEAAVLRTRLQRVSAPESQPLHGYLGEDFSQGTLLCFWHICIHSTNTGWALRSRIGEGQCLLQLGTLSTPGV